MKYFLLIIIALQFSIPIPFAHADDSRVLFRRKMHGKLGWYAEGNEKKNEIYLGHIENGKPNGSGTLTHPNGGRYVGGFMDGLPNGQGILKLPDGKKYDGEWKKGIKDGQGACTFSDGSTYIGELKDGLINGSGTFTYFNGNKYSGQWKFGKKDGKGTFTFFDGRKKSGEFRADEHWNIKMYSKDGAIISEWINGKEIFDEKQNVSIIHRLWRGRMGWFDDD